MRYGGQYWLLLSNLADVTIATPSVSAAWALYGAAPWLRKTAAYTAVVGDRIKASTTAGAWSLTLPASPNDGDCVEVMDVDGTFGINNLTVLASGGKKVMGNTVSWVLDTPNFHPVFYYDAANSDWRI